MAISDYSSTPSSNTTISGINIAEGCAPAVLNNAIRQMMADVSVLAPYATDATRFVPPGAVFGFAMNAAPTGYLKANGAAVSRTTYAALFAAIGTTWGAGDGSTTFNIPDLRGEFVRGWDDSRGVDSARSFASAQSAAMLNHTHSGTTSSNGNHNHTVNDPGHAHGYTDAGGQGMGGPGSGISYDAGPFQFVYTSRTSSGAGTGIYLSDAGTHTHTMTTGNPSTGGGTETRPRNIALLYCIKY